jgi:uncharacterized protein (DUF58 family)
MSEGGTLLDPDFIQRLARLRLLVRRRFAGTAGGSRRSKRRGASVEFADHRAYAPGDDVRRIDWNAYARLEELVLRLYVAEEDLTVYLLVDRSASMAFGDPPKLESAKRLAAALAYVALSGSERVAVVPFGDGPDVPLPPTRGKRRVGHVLRYLDAIEPSGETSLTRTVDRFLARRPRPGLVAIIGDLLDPAGWTRPLDRLLSEKHEPAIFHVLSHEELDPPRGGDFAFVDAERGTSVEVSLDRRAREAYAKRLRGFLGEVEAYAKKRGLSYVRVEGDLALEEALMGYLRAG